LAAGLAVALIALLAVLHVGADNVIYNWTPKLLEGLRPAGPGRPFAPALALTLYEGAYVACRTLFAFLPERTGEKRFLIFPGLLGGALLLGGLCSDSYWLMALAIPAGAFFWGWSSRR